MKNARTLTALIAIMLLSLVATSTFATETVSPGATDRMAVVETRCPTFSWGEDNDPAAYDLVAYVLPEDAAKQADLTAETEVLYTRVAGNATSWTPSADQCFAPGGRYVWFVRAVSELDGDEVVAAGEWSAGRYLEVPAAPSPEEVERAIEVMKWLEASGSSGASIISSGTGFLSDADSDADSDAGWASPKSVPTASAAIRGEHPDISGEKYGVVGTTASIDGAGVAAANLGSGPDLVLDGSAAGAADTRLWEGGLDRPSAADQSFVFANSGAGLIDVHVQGDLSGNRVTGDELWVPYGMVVDDEGQWQGEGATVPCAGCVSSSDIADGSVNASDLATSSVTSPKILNGAVGTVDLADDAVTGAKIADATIGPDDIHGNSVDGGHLVDGSVGNADLADGAVTGPKLADGSVGSTKLRSNAVTNAHLADDAVTSAEVADGSITGFDLATSSISTAHLNDWSVTGAKLADDAVSASHLASGAVNSEAIQDNSITASDLADSEGLYVYGPIGDGLYVGDAGDNGVEIGGANGDGLYINTAGGDGVRVSSAGEDGIDARTSAVSGFGGKFSNGAAGGGGVYAIGGGNDAADLVLGGTSGGDDGRIYSQPELTGSDILVFSNDNVHVHLDEDGGSTSGFKIYDGSNTEVWGVTESGMEVSSGPSAARLDAGEDQQQLVYAILSPQNWLEDFGNGHVTGDEAVVWLDQAFARAANLQETYHVFLTPRGDCPLFVAGTGVDRFTVRSLGKQQCDIDFDFRVVALRRGYEALRMERFVSGDDD